MLSRIKAGIKHPGEILDIQFILFQQSRYRFRDKSAVPDIAYPSVFPGAVEFVCLCSPVVYEIIGDRVRALDCGNGVAIAQKQGARTVPAGLLLAAASLAHSAIGRTA